MLDLYVSIFTEHANQKTRCHLSGSRRVSKSACFYCDLRGTNLEDLRLPSLCTLRSVQALYRCKRKIGKILKNGDWKE